MITSPRRQRTPRNIPGGKDMTDRQLDKIIQMIRMVLDGCTDLNEAKKKIDQLMDSQGKNTDPKAGA